MKVAEQYVIVYEHVILYGMKCITGNMRRCLPREGSRSIYGMKCTMKVANEYVIFYGIKFIMKVDQYGILYRMKCIMKIANQCVYIMNLAKGYVIHY
jgi:hypothetical protein